MKELIIALVGQPNVGKSMLINAIADARLKVGNFSGVTVEKAEVSFFFQDYAIKIVDLPGTYSLNDYTQDERVTKEFLENEASQGLIYTTQSNQTFGQKVCDCDFVSFSLCHDAD